MLFSDRLCFEFIAQGTQIKQFQRTSDLTSVMTYMEENMDPMAQKLALACTEAQFDEKTELYRLTWVLSQTGGKSGWWHSTEQL